MTGEILRLTGFQFCSQQSVWIRFGLMMSAFLLTGSQGWSSTPETGPETAPPSRDTVLTDEPDSKILVVFSKTTIHPWLIFSTDESESKAENWIYLSPLPDPVPQTTLAECNPASSVARFPALQQSTPFESPVLSSESKPTVASVESTGGAIPQQSYTVFTAQPTSWVEWQPAPDLTLAGQNDSAPDYTFVCCNETLIEQYHSSNPPEQPVKSTNLPPVSFASGTQDTSIHQLVKSETISESPVTEPPSSLSDANVTTSSVCMNHESSGCTDQSCDASTQNPFSNGNTGVGEDSAVCRSGTADSRGSKAAAMGLSTQREQAPLQLLWPNRWAWEAARDPWPNVLNAENAQSMSEYHGSLHSHPLIEDRANGDAKNSVQLLKDLPVSEMILNIRPTAGRMPQERSGPLGQEQPVLAHSGPTERGWNASEVYWNAPQTTHAPLYFEENSLERAGYSRGYVQPVVSGLKFFTTAAFLPGLMTIDPPNSVQYELGEDRPGSIVAYSTRVPEWTVKAIAVQTGAVLGLSILIP